MKIDITFGVLLSDITGERETTVYTDSETLTVEQLAKMILDKYEGLGTKLQKIHLTRDSILSSIFVIDQNIVRPDHVMTGDTRVKILPPIAGG